jgi:hypothetical protein
MLPLERDTNMEPCILFLSMLPSCSMQFRLWSPKKHGYNSYSNSCSLKALPLENQLWFCWVHWRSCLSRVFNSWHHQTSFGMLTQHYECHNLSLEFTTKARAYKSARQVWSLGVTFHAPESVRKCEGMNPHTPKWSPTLGIGVLMDS